jgi:CheY-like chemotaxis protein
MKTNEVGRAEKPRILVADDDLANRALLVEVCVAEGYEADVALDGGEVVERALTGAYDLLLLDAMMPVLDGYDALAILRRAQATSKLPVIMVTASSHERDRLRAGALGVDEFVHKPFRIFDLTQRMRLLIDRTRQAEEAGEAGAGQPPVAARQRMGELLRFLPSPRGLRAYLDRALRDARRGRRPLGCAMLRLESEDELLRRSGRQAVDAVLGLMASGAQGWAEGGVYRCNEGELVWLLSEGKVARLAVLPVDLRRMAAGLLADDPEPAPVDLRLAALVLREARGGADDLLAQLRTLLDEARRAGGGANSGGRGTLVPLADRRSSVPPSSRS